MQDDLKHLFVSPVVSAAVEAAAEADPGAAGRPGHHAT